jgi:hypothetical protein
MSKHLSHISPNNMSLVNSSFAVVYSFYVEGIELGFVLRVQLIIDQKIYV